VHIENSSRMSIWNQHGLPSELIVKHDTKCCDASNLAEAGTETLPDVLASRGRTKLGTERGLRGWMSLKPNRDE